MEFKIGDKVNFKNEKVLFDYWACGGISLLEGHSIDCKTIFEICKIMKASFPRTYAYVARLKLSKIGKYSIPVYTNRLELFDDRSF